MSPQARRAALIVRRLRRQQDHATMRDLHTRGWTQQAIAIHLGLHPKTVSRQLRLPADGPPERQRRRSILAPYHPYLHDRWTAGCTNASQLFREITAQGYTGTASTVRAWATTLRTVTPDLTPASTAAAAPARPAVTPWTPAAPSRTRSARQEERHQRDTTIHDLHALGWEQRAIAAHLGVHPKTVSRNLRRAPDVVEERALRPSILDPYLPYLIARWEDGCTNASRLFRELVAQGFPGKASLVRDVVAALRNRTGQHARRVATVTRRGDIPTRATLATWIIRPPHAVTPEQQTVLQQLADRSPDLATTITLAQAFGAMVRNRQAVEFDPWLIQMEGCGIPAFARLARGMRQDEAAIRAALTLPWSNGPVEGTINRLKMIKRSMYDSVGEFPPSSVRQ